jgi:hypothetical protein
MKKRCYEMQHTAYDRTRDNLGFFVQARRQESLRQKSAAFSGQVWNTALVLFYIPKNILVPRICGLGFVSTALSYIEDLVSYQQLCDSLPYMKDAPYMA